MSVIYQKEKKQFLLHTVHTTYAMEVYGGCLAHSYWGHRIANVPTIDERYACGLHGSMAPVDLQGELLYSTDLLPQEYPTFGSADLRHPALHIRYADGSNVTRLRFESYRMLQGKPKLMGLPATYGTEAECETLEIVLLDAVSKIRVVLYYTVFPELDIITRSSRIVNEADKSCVLERAASFALDIVEDDFTFVHLRGAWARERHIAMIPMEYGTVSIDSARGASGHSENPFFAMKKNDATETKGEVMGFALVYSGNFLGEASMDHYASTRIQMGINPLNFHWNLGPGEEFQTPEAILCYSDQGLGEMSRRFHRIIRKNLCRGVYRDAPRPVLINNWEATYFDFDQNKIVEIAKKAKLVGVELVVLDDGWFGKRNSDDCSLGDWKVNTEKLPEGLSGLAQRINSLDMNFGLWFEPEMVSPNSELYQTHPDWCIHTPGRERTQSRNQLILDMSREEVSNYIIDALSEILTTTAITYVKWDMNRNMTEAAGAEQAHRYILGLYHIMDELTTRFPNVLFEGCSSGGGRFDAGFLYYMPQFWTSDDTDAVERLYIQEGTSLVYPIGTMGAHVSAVPNHQTGRTTPLDFRGAVASMGRYGLELDLTKLTQEELNEISTQIQEYHRYEQVVHAGDLYRLRTAYSRKDAAYQIISEDGSTVLVFDFCIVGEPNGKVQWLKLQGLDAEAVYEDVETGKCVGGDSLMYAGIPVSHGCDLKTQKWVLVKR